MIPVKEIILKYGDATLFFTRPVWILNYAIGDIWSRFSLSISKTFPSIQLDKKKKILIEFPVVHKDDVLLGCVMGHELGHYFDLHSGLNLTDSLMPSLLKHSNINDLKQFVNLKLTSSSILLTKDQENRIKNEILVNILGKGYLINWLQEFIADIIGILLYGPSSHFSGDSIFTYSSLANDGTLHDAFSNTHPRSSIRSVVRERTFEKLNYTGKFSSVIQEEINISIQKWKSAKTKLFLDSIDGSYGTDIIFRFELNNTSLAIIEDILVSELDDIIDYILNTIPDELHYNVEKYHKIVPQLAAKISNFIPPNEIDSEPVDSISILNAGWHAYFHYRDKLETEISSNEQEYNIREMINNLVKKALMSAHIHRGWNDDRTN
ncbi:hypothetical protein [Gracilibacillus ureilyticus]|nr:hypothetical protein [Gracilibacillus ureilyticus]